LQKPKKETMIELNDVLTAILGLITGGGLSWAVFFRANKRKANSEADVAAVSVWKEMQDVYQRALADQKGYYEEIKEYTNDLREDRNHLRKDRDDQREENAMLRKRLNAMEEKVITLENDVARNEREIESMRPVCCYRMDCKDRMKKEVPQKPKRTQKTEG